MPEQLRTASTELAQNLLSTEPRSKTSLLGPDELLAAALPFGRFAGGADDELLAAALPFDRFAGGADDELLAATPVPAPQIFRGEKGLACDDGRLPIIRNTPPKTLKSLNNSWLSFACSSSFLAFSMR